MSAYSSTKAPFTNQTLNRFAKYRGASSSGSLPQNQSIAGFPPTLGLTMAQTPYTLPATTDQGLTVTYTVTSGPATVSGNTLTLTGTGTVVVHAAQAGNTNYNPYSSNETITVTLAAQTVTGFPPTLTLSISASPYTLPLRTDQGLTISYSVTSGPATVSGNTLTITAGGTVVVAASQAGNTIYAPYSGSETITVNKLNQTVNSGFPPTQTVTYGVGTVTFPANTDQGLTITYTVTSGPATVAGNVATITGAGTVVIAASQAGNGTYNSWSGGQTITVNQANQTVSGFPSSITVYLNQSPYTLPATSDQGVAMTYSVTSGPASVSGNTLTITSNGTVVVNGSNAGNANYNAYSSNETVTVPAFSPSQLSGLTLWLDAQDNSTITQSSGKVSQWNDKSGGSRNVTQGTSANQPTVTANAINGNQALSFNGSNVLNNPSVNLGTAAGLSLYGVWNANALAGYQHLMTLGVPATSPTGTSYSVVNADGSTNSLNMYAGGAAVGSSVAVSLNTNYYSLCTQDGSGNCAFYLNGTNKFNTAPGGTSSSTGYLAIGSKYNFTYNWSGYIGEILIYDRVLTASEQTLVNNYLHSKWGI